VTQVVECVATPEVRVAGADGMIFAPNEEAAALNLPGPAFHTQAAAALEPVLRSMA